MFGKEFKPKSAAALLIESLVPPEVWAGIIKASNDIPQMVVNIQQTMESVDSRLETIMMKLDRLEQKIDPSAAAPETPTSLLDLRVQQAQMIPNALNPDDVELLTNIPISDMQSPPKFELRSPCPISW